MQKLVDLKDEVQLKVQNSFIKSLNRIIQFYYNTVVITLTNKVYFWLIIN